MATKIIYSKEVEENTFMGITPPEYKFFNVKLSQCATIGKEKKSGKEVSRVYDYTININIAEINEDQTLELGKILQDLFQLKWIPYDYKTKSYNYFTTRYVDETVKKSQLTQILEYLEEFEIDYAQKIKHSLEIFNEDSISKTSYKDAEIAVKYDENKKSFVVVALSYLGAEKYSLLSKASIDKGVLEKEEDKTFFSDLVEDKILNSKKKLFYFVVKPASYISVKSFIEKQVVDNNNFYETQKQIIENIHEDFPLYDKPNLFDFKITYNDSLKCFNFYCKGYNENTNPNTNEHVDRVLLGNWALNYFLSEEISSEEDRDKISSELNDPDISRYNYYKIPLDFRPGSSNKDKNWIVPASDIESLRKIKNNFLEYEELFSRQEETIKVIDNDIYSSTSSLNRYPSIYIDEHGKPYFIYNFRNIAGSKKNEKTNYVDFSQELIQASQEVDILLQESTDKKPKIKKERLPSVNMKGVPISFKEMEKFFNNHDWADQIKQNSILLNTDIWFKGENANLGITYKEREEMFDRLYFRAKLYYESSLIMNDKKTTVKKRKL